MVNTSGRENIDAKGDVFEFHRRSLGVADETLAIELDSHSIRVEMKDQGVRSARIDWSRAMPAAGTWSGAIN